MLDDAAKIDGCNKFTIFTKVIFPICLPIVITIAMFQYLASWNDFIGPIIYLRDQYHYPLTVTLANFSPTMVKVARWDLKMAGAAMVALPPIIIFMFTQRQFMSGLMQGAIKG